MKRIHIITLLFALFSAGFAGCNLDRFPETAMAEKDFWNPQSEDEFKYAVNQLYVLLGHRWGDTRADDLFRNNYPDDISAGTRKVPAKSDDWSNPYKMVFWANRIIEHAPEHGTTASQIDRFVAEAYFFRAYAYYQLVCKFGGVPILVNTAGDIDDSILYGPRASREEVMTRIYTDLNLAARELPLPSALADGEFGRISRTAAQAFKARAALYEGTRRKFHGEEQAEPHLKIAYEAADSVIQSGEHTLYTKGTQPYKDLFEYTGEEASEHVLVKLYGYQETQLLTHNYPYQIAVNYGVSRNFLNLYLNDTGLPFEDDPSLQLTYNDYFDGRDPRLAETALRRGVNTYQFGPFVPYAQSRTGFGIRKYVRNDGMTDQPSTLDYPLLRYAEVLLTYAEARFEHDGIISDEDLNRTVNALRDRVGMAHLTNEFVTSNHLDMRTELRRERSVELALEGLRYDDLIRWKEAEIRLPQDVLGARVIAGEWGSVSPGSLEDKLTAQNVLIVEEGTSRFFDPKKDYLYPIPSNDIAQSRGNVEQNPNWK